MPCENLSLSNLVHSENKNVNKVIITFSSIVLEMDNLINEAKSNLYYPLLLYGEPG